MTYPGFYRVLGCYLHILDQRDFEKLYSKGQAPHINRRWQPELEIHPDDEKIALFFRSKERASQILCTEMWEGAHDIYLLDPKKEQVRHFALECGTDAMGFTMMKIHVNI